MVTFSKVEIGQFYDRPQLARIWGYKGHQALSRGVITPTNTNIIILFVTKEKQSSSTQYVDYIHDDYLYWEGEEKGGNNQRIINADRYKDEIHLFYRHRHHEPFQYKGLVKLQSYIPIKDSPFQFIFKIVAADVDISEFLVEEDFSNSRYKLTEKQCLVLSRVGQGIFRIKLMKLWSSCAVSDIRVPEILRASHIKPWRDCNNAERLNHYNGLLLTPMYDCLFDKGFISFNVRGEIIISKSIKSFSSQLQISEDIKLRKIFTPNLEFLEYHRDTVFLK